jgi:uncharacterized protein YjbJ (UPF0337 family)
MSVLHQTGKVKAQWGKLTNDQLDVIAGNRTQLAGKTQEAYGVTKEEAETQIKRFEEVNKEHKDSTKAVA